MIHIREVTISEYLPNIGGVIRAHWQELESGLFPEGPDIKLGIFSTAEELGILYSLGVFDGDEIVGYSMLTVTPHAHYDCTIATSTAIFLRKEYRKGSTGLTLLRRTEELATRLGARYLSVAAKFRTDLDHILARKGYIRDAVVRVKELTAWPG